MRAGAAGIDKAMKIAHTLRMHTFRRKEALLLASGDIVLFFVSLWVTLLLRYGSVPDLALMRLHLVPFSLLFVAWVAVFFIAGLYERQTLVVRRKIPGLLLRASVANVVIAAAFFYLIPFFSITPKTILFIYLFVSISLIALWRLLLFPLFRAHRHAAAVFVGEGDEMKELIDEIRNNPKYGISASVLENFPRDPHALAEEISRKIKKESVSLVIGPFSDETFRRALGHLYENVFRGVRFLDSADVYESVFGRVPVSLIDHGWLFAHMSPQSHFVYDAAKRIVDMFVSAVGIFLTLPFYPFIALAIVAEDGGPVFFRARRLGRGGKEITLVKFRSMSSSSRGGGIEDEPRTTAVGRFLRKTRIDEIPQLFNVLRGDLSLVGPRPETPALAETYEGSIPYYTMRLLIKPGLSGWAQIYHDEHPHHGVDVKETKRKLSYDLFYVKNRSFFLDIKIILKTAKILLSAAGK